jgi:hypothetical protein
MEKGERGYAMGDDIPEHVEVTVSHTEDGPGYRVLAVMLKGRREAVVDALRVIGYTEEHLERQGLA